MGRKTKHKPSFFKILLLDFTHQLRLPPVFVKKYGSNLPESVKLRISGKTWKVKVEEMEDSHQYLTLGWNKFVKDLGLEIGEFLVFRMTATAVLRVSVYEITGCRREFHGNEFPSCEDDESEKKYRKCNDPRDMDSRKRSRPGNDGMSESEEGNPQLCYTFTLKLYKKSRLTLQKKLVRAAGFKRLQIQHITLEYLPGHRHHVVTMVHRKQHRIELTTGWADFLKANLAYGKTYPLEFIRNKNVIQIKEVETDSSC